MTDAPQNQPVPPTSTPPSGDPSQPAPDQTLPGEVDPGNSPPVEGQEVDAEGNPIPPGQREDKERGKSEDARGRNKPEPR